MDNCLLSSYGYFKYSEYYPSTDDAYVGASLVNVAPKANGYLAELNIHNNQVVHKGDLLFKINPVDYNFSYGQAQKNYDSYVSQVTMIEQQIGVQKASVVKSEAQYNLAREILDRYKQLYATKTLSKQAYDNAATNLKTAKAQMDIENKRLAQIQSGISILEAKRDSAKIGLDSAQSNMSFTEYRSPVDGYVSNLNSLHTGEYIALGQQMFGIVDNSKWWIDANFKETQLERIKPGQSVTIELDMYEHKYHGVVQSVSYSSGNTFSLLPAQNATGNWVKVTQRFAVRISVDNDAAHPLRVGASAFVKIDTTSKAKI